MEKAYVRAKALPFGAEVLAGFCLRSLLLLNDDGLRSGGLGNQPEDEAARDESYDEVRRRDVIYKT